MGIRCDQHMGLNEAARKLVEGERVVLYTEETRRTHLDGRVEVLPSREVFGSSVRCEPSGKTYTGMFGDEYALHRYAFPDGRVLTEDVQAEPWSSGPVFFLALRDERGEWVPESLWPESAIEDA